MICHLYFVSGLALINWPVQCRAVRSHKASLLITLKKTDDNHYRISLALAGFKQSELDIEVEGPRLTVRGKPTPVEKQVEYLHQGLVRKEFSLTFTLAEHLNVDNAQFENGLLHIDLLRQVPEALQPQRIAIGSATPQERQVLESPEAPDQQ